MTSAQPPAPAPDSSGPSADRSRPDVSVVVVNWNTRDLLRECLASVRRETTDVSYEVFVVDNASADGSADMVRADFPSVRLLANAENRGFAAANNQALRLARGRYALLLNPDTLVLDGAIGRTVRIADADPSIGVLGCQCRHADGRVQRTCARFPSVLGEALLAAGLHRVVPRWFGGGPEMAGWDRLSARDVDVVAGMYMLVRREAMEEVGLLDEDYFVYAEETDWCFRFRRHGWRRCFTPDAAIVHHEGGGRSTSQVRVRMYVQLQKSLLICFRKNRGIAAWLAAKCLYAAGMAARTIVFALARPFSRSEETSSKLACSRAALRYHLTGHFPER